jgi:hypothetical protein
MIEYLEGKKTYVTGAVIFALLFGNWQGWWKIPTEVYAGLLSLEMVFLRMGVSKIEQTK